jgi:YD repeat-containing protein
MKNLRSNVLAAFGWLFVIAASASAQTPTYYLHSENSVDEFCCFQLKTTSPDSAGVIFLSGELKNLPPQTGSLRLFITNPNVPGIAGTIASGTTLTATFWMRKTAAFGVVLPRAEFSVNFLGTPLCTATGTAGPAPIPDQRLTTTIAEYTFSCQTTSAVTTTNTDKIFVRAGFNMTTGPGNKSMKVELRYEGNVAPIYNSRIAVPNPVPPVPSITNLNPSSAPVNTSVIATGTNFGATQGSSTIKFNGTTATPTNWSSTSITAPVPAGATSGPVVVTVNGVPSTGTSFTVIPPPTLSTLTPSTAHLSDAVVIAGNNFLNSQGTSTVKFNGTTASPTNWSNTSITVPVPSGATNGNVVVTVSNQASNGLPFTVIPPPALKWATPTSGQVGASTTIVGTNFGATQGSSTIAFNGTTAAVTSWGNTSIIATVPSGATTGNVTVTVSNQASNGVPFSVLLPGTMGGTITRVTGGTPISGATVQAVLAGVVKGSSNSAANGTYSISGLDPGSYDVRVFASGFANELRQTVAVTSSTSTTLDVGMYQPGSASGRVTQIDGITPLVGAAVTVYVGPSQKGSTNTNATGDYLISGLRPGSYTVQAANVGYTTREQSAAVTESAATTTNFSLNGAPSVPVLYAYDELGRLVQVTDPSGASAIYRYDEVGNIIAIERPGTTALAISSFSPTSGAVPATVTIYGSGFNATAASNTVTFNGTAATVDSASPTQLVVTVPSGATTGAVAVTNTVTSGSATTTTNFTVTTSQLPVITSFTPAAGASPTALGIDGTGFDPVAANNIIKLNATFVQPSSGTATHLSTAVPPNASSGRIRVSTVAGTGTSATDFWIPPPPNPLGGPPFTTAKLEFKARMNGFGVNNSVQATIGTSGNIGLILFDGVPGQRVTVKTTAGNTGNTAIRVISPSNVEIAEALAINNFDSFIDVLTLGTTGSYTVTVEPSTTGNITVIVFDVPGDFTGTITPGGSPVPATISIPGQKAAITFTAAVGQRISLSMTGIGSGCTIVAIKKPDTTLQASQNCLTTTGAFIDRQVLTVAGTYTIAIDPDGTATTGTTTLTLHDVPADITGPLTINGGPMSVPITVPGQNASATFAGNATQAITVPAPHATKCATLTLLRQDNVTVVASAFCNALTTTLPATETYNLRMDPSGADTGTYSLRVNSP